MAHKHVSGKWNAAEHKSTEQVMVTVPKNATYDVNIQKKKKMATLSTLSRELPSKQTGTDLGYIEQTESPRNTP